MEMHSSLPEVQINQAVNNHFKDVEVSDSYYSEKSGYWFYYRLSKAKWAAIQAMEKMAIDDRVKSLINPVYDKRRVDISCTRFLHCQKAGILLLNHHMREQ